MSSHRSSSSIFPDIRVQTLLVPVANTRPRGWLGRLIDACVGRGKHRPRLSIPKEGT